MHPKIKSAHNRFLEFQEITRGRGLTALLVIQVFLIFVVVPLSGMDAIPPSVVPMAFALLVLAILVVTSRSYVVSALVLIRPPSETTMPGPPRF